MDIINSMVNSVAERVAEAIPNAIRESFGSRLRALYLYGSLAEGRYVPQQSDVNLLAVIEDEVRVRDVRNALRPLWLRERHNLRIAPIVSSLPVLERHLELEPNLARHLSKQGILLAGIELLPRPKPVSDIEKLAKIAHDAMLASSALTSTLLPAKAAKKSMSRLLGLASGLSPTSDGTDCTAAELMAQVQNQISREMQHLDLLRFRGRSVSKKRLLISDLQAIYETEDMIVLVLPDLSPERVTEVMLSTDWAEVAARVEGKYQSLLVTTAGQLRLILKYELAADYHLYNYVHAWGGDPIDGLDIADWRVLRHLARLSSELQIATLPQAYIEADESALSMLVHDFQNKLLNIQLRSELFGKISGRKSRTPPLTPADRNAPIHERVESIYQHVAWWSDYHAAEMEHLRADSV
jgi:predicted nucleotidyltransferase